MICTYKNTLKEKRLSRKTCTFWLFHKLFSMGSAIKDVRSEGERGWLRCGQMRTFAGFECMRTSSLQLVIIRNERNSTHTVNRELPTHATMSWVQCLVHNAIEEWRQFGIVVQFNIKAMQSFHPRQWFWLVRNWWNSTLYYAMTTLDPRYNALPHHIRTQQLLWEVESEVN